LDGEVATLLCLHRHGIPFCVGIGHNDLFDTGLYGELAVRSLVACVDVELETIPAVAAGEEEKGAVRLIVAVVEVRL
jgi:hypothetical protein